MECAHKRIEKTEFFDFRTDQQKARITCKRCRSVLGEWFVPSDGQDSLHEAWYRERYVFGKRYRLESEDAHELK